MKVFLVAILLIANATSLLASENPNVRYECGWGRDYSLEFQKNESTQMVRLINGANLLELSEDEHYVFMTNNVMIVIGTPPADSYFSGFIVRFPRNPPTSIFNVKLEFFNRRDSWQFECTSSNVDVRQ